MRKNLNQSAKQSLQYAIYLIHIHIYGDYFKINSQISWFKNVQEKYQIPLQYNFANKKNWECIIVDILTKESSMLNVSWQHKKILLWINKR